MQKAATQEDAMMRRPRRRRRLRYDADDDDEPKKPHGDWSSREEARETDRFIDAVRLVRNELAAMEDGVT